MTLQTWLAAELRAGGLTVAETAGWQTRQTHDGFNPQGIVCHDTVTPPGISREAEQAILIKGRPDLAGPLAQLGLHRDGVVSVIAAGRCNHNGGDPNDGLPDPIWGNDAYGIEVFCYGGQVGHLEPWNLVQQKAVAEIAAVISHHHGWDESRTQGHKETDPRRKIDPFGIVMGAIRADVHGLLHPAPPVPSPVDPEVAEVLRLYRANSVTYLCNYYTGKRHTLGPIELDHYLKVVGLTIEDVDQLVVGEFEDA